MLAPEVPAPEALDEELVVGVTPAAEVPAPDAVVADGCADGLAAGAAPVAPLVGDGVVESPPAGVAWVAPLVGVAPVDPPGAGVVAADAPPAPLDTVGVPATAPPVVPAAPPPVVPLDAAPAAGVVAAGVLDAGAELQAAMMEPRTNAPITAVIAVRLVKRERNCTDFLHK